MIEWLREWAANYVATVFTSRNVITLQGYFADEEVANILRMFINWLERTGASPWRSVEDGLPPSTVSVAVLRATGDWDKGYYGDNPWMGNSEKAWRYTNEERIEGVTHWMPLPPLPKEGE